MAQRTTSDATVGISPTEEELRRQELQASQFEHTGVLLWWASRAWMGEFRRRLNRAGYEDLPEGAFNSVLPYLDIAGTRTTVLAQRAGISKQAVNQFVDQLESMGYVARIADTSDGRAKIVRYVGRGIKFVRDNQRIKRELETEVAAALSGGKLERLHSDLRALVKLLQPPTSD
jgi:DNA-binding MarR family transcriptional regulator